MNQTADMIKKAFPDKVDNIFAVLGNHDVYPHWDFSKNDGNPAANEYAPIWKDWLDDDASY